jgi:hypothetical protein
VAQDTNINRYQSIINLLIGFHPKEGEIGGVRNAHKVAVLNTLRRGLFGSVYESVVGSSKHSKEPSVWVSVRY